jgi:hypothetical protein
MSVDPCNASLMALRTAGESDDREVMSDERSEARGQGQPPTQG